MDRITAIDKTLNNANGRLIQMKFLIFISLLSVSSLFGEDKFPKPSTGVSPVVFNDKLAYFSANESNVTIIDSRTNIVKQVPVSHRVISMFQMNGDLCLITIDGQLQRIGGDGNLAVEKILENGGVISASSIGNRGDFVLLAFRDGDQGLMIIRFSKEKEKLAGRVISKNLPRGVLTSGRGSVWFNSEQKSFKISME